MFYPHKSNLLMHTAGIDGHSYICNVDSQQANEYYKILRLRVDDHKQVFSLSIFNNSLVIQVFLKCIKCVCKQISMNNYFRC